MAVLDACRPAAGGVRLEIEVVPGSSRPGFPTGYNPWRRRIQARVAAAPTGGDANRELVERVATFFGVGAGEVVLVGGHASRHKSLTVCGLTPEEAAARLGPAAVGP